MTFTTQHGNSINNPLILLSASKYDSFCIRLKKEISNSPTLDIFKDKFIYNFIIQLCDEIFSEEISYIISLLNNVNIGIAALDIPESSFLNKTDDAVYGSATVIGIFNKIGKSNIDSIDSTPFTLHTASHSSGKLLESIDSNIPEVKLGFHNDGLINFGNLEIPNHIVLYNLYISYRKPGKFKWIPTSLWDKADEYGRIAINKKIKIKIRLTPYVHKNKEGNIKKTEFNYVEIPVININQSGQKIVFLNGKVLDDENIQENINFVQEIRQSLENNSTKIEIDQKVRRAFYLKNIMGFHARDVFQDPISDVDLTRVFLRSVDVNTEAYPSTPIQTKENSLA